MHGKNNWRNLNVFCTWAGVFLCLSAMALMLGSSKSEGSSGLALKINFKRVKYSFFNSNWNKSTRNMKQFSNQENRSFSCWSLVEKFQNFKDKEEQKSHAEANQREMTSQISEINIETENLSLITTLCDKSIHYYRFCLFWNHLLTWVNIITEYIMCTEITDMFLFQIKIFFVLLWRSCFTMKQFCYVYKLQFSRETSH